MSDGYVIEASLEAGFVMTNDDGDEFACNEVQVVAFANMAREPLLNEIERLRDALRDIIAIPNSEAAQGIMKVIARAALGEGKE